MLTPNFNNVIIKINTLYNYKIIELERNFIMLHKTMLSKILLTAIAIITVISPLGVSANPTSSQTNEEETTTVSNQETFANPDLISPLSSVRKRRPAEPASYPPPDKKTKLESPYKVVIDFDNSNEKNPCIIIKLFCTTSNPTKEQKDLMEKFCEEIIRAFSFKEYVIDDVTNSIMIINKIFSMKRAHLNVQIIESVISYISERYYNKNFNNINILN